MKGFMKTLCFIFVSLSVCSSALAAGKVLLVNSYYTDYPWAADITEGVKKGLEGSGAQLEIFYMDTKRKTTEEWKVEIGKLAMEKVEKFKPDVIIPMDDNALWYFGKHYFGKEIPVVFGGINEELSKYGYPAANATGVIQKAIFAESIDLLLRIKPDVKKIAVISDDGETSTAILSYMKTLKVPVEVVSYDQPATFAEWKALIKKYQTTVDAIAINLYQTVKEVIGQDSLPQKVIMDWTMENSKLPTIGFFPDAFDDGVFCGIAESGEVQGYEAAKIAVQILQGKKPADFPVVIPTKGVVIINMNTAEKLGITVPFDVLESANKVIE